MTARVIEVVDHDPSWPQRFAAEAERFRAAVARAGVADEMVAVEHVGSTAVPGLAAKPVVDVMVGLSAWPASAELIAAVEGLGYVHRGEAGIVGRHYFIDGDPGGPRTCHVHAVEHGGRFWRDHLLFRETLAREATTRAAYAKLKCDLARRHPHNSLAYTDGKTGFIREVLQRARAESGDAVVHAAASGFDTDPQRYERARPGYPPAAVAFLVAQLALGPEVRVADLGAGTGKLTQELAATGADVVAVEPMPAMRAHLAETLPQVTRWAATAEELPAAMGSVDALAAGQAFHWFDPAAALSEAYRVLRAGGRLGLVWNVRDQTVPWVARWTELVDRVADGVPRAHQRRWEDVVAATDLFDHLDTRTFANTHQVARETAVERLASTSAVAALDADRRRALLDEFRAALDTDPATRGRDDIAVPYRTEVTVLRRNP